MILDKPLLDAPGASDEPPWRWELGTGLAELRRLAASWNDLAHRGALSPTADAIWMEAFWTAYATRDDDLVIHSLHAGDRLLAVLPMRQSGRLALCWRSIRNPEWPYWMFCMDEQQAGVSEAVLSRLLQMAEYLDFWPLHARGALCTGLATAARAHGMTVVQTDRGDDAFIHLFAPWEDFCRSLPHSLEQKGTARKLRQLQRQGLRFEQVSGGPELDAALQACFELETKGWKGQYGAPILSDPRSHAFYTRLARASAAAGRFALYLLKLQDRLIAFEYCLRAQRKIDLLKPSYDPELAKFSPGNVLRWLILQHEIALGEIDSYHLGRSSDWKKHWVTRTEPLTRLRIYGPGFRSRLAYHGGPRLRAAVKRLPGVHRVYHALRR